MQTRVTRNMTGFRGVYWDTSHGKYVAEIGSRTLGTRRRLGRFESAKQAAEAYDIAAQELYGQDAILNFPLNGSATFKISMRRDSERTCAYGHEYPKYEYFEPQGRVHCRECNRLAVQKAALKRKARP